MQKKGEPIFDIKADDITRLDWSLTGFLFHLFQDAMNVHMTYLDKISRA